MGLFSPRIAPRGLDAISQQHWLLLHRAIVGSLGSRSLYSWRHSASSALL
jgi:hypothetical protein